MQPNNQVRPGVLIVDDEPQVATALADMLEDRYRVVTETSPEAGLNVLEGDKGIAVILSDQRMPGMTGDELFARAKEISIATRILITAYADISAVIDAVNQGRIFGYIAKPWHRGDLVQTVKRAADYCDLNRKVRHEQALLHQLMESSIDAIAIKDPAHRYVKLNGQISRMLGVDESEAVEGRADSEFLPTERAEAIRRRESAVLGTGIPLRNCVDEIVSDDGQPAWYSSNLSPIRDLHGDVMGLVSITRDVTEAKRLDIMKDQFIATVSHELRTPLTAIRGSLDLLRGGVSGAVGDQASRLIEIGHSNCSRLILLINDLLDTVSLEKGEMRFARETADLWDIVQAAVAATGSRARAREVTVGFERDSAAVMVEADSGRLLQALCKLVDNAIEVTPSGGEVRLLARQADDGKVRICVLDRGPGVPDEFHSRIFRRFSQADSSNTREKGGVGLGLYIARSIVDAHGGSVGFANRPGGGAEFHIELPAAVSRRRAKTSMA